MGKTFILADDLTGETLPNDTKPVRLSLGRRAYDLYLSDDSHGKLLEALNEFTKNAEKVTPEAATPAPAVAEAAEGTALPTGTKSRFAEAKRAQMDLLRKWAKDNKIDLPKKGAPESSVYDKFFGDNDELPRLIGRGAMSIEEWHAAEQEAGSTDRLIVSQ